MEFSLSDDQRMLQESIRGVLETTSPLDEVRKVAHGDTALRDKMSASLAELGTGMALVPEAQGGLGLGLLDAVVVQVALGEAVSPAGFTASGAMATMGIVAAGNADQRDEWLGKIATGDVRFGVAVAERTGAREGAGVEARDGKLSGKALFAMETDGASHLLICDTTGRLHVAQASDAERNDLTTIDKTRDFAELIFDGTPATPLDGENEVGAAADRMVAAGRVLLAADTIGASQAMLDKAVAYAKERKQFNRVIGSFQSVKHMCAEMAAQLEPARALVWHAAYAFDERADEADLMICLAKSHASEIGTFIARTSTEVHGGMGFTDLVGLHYWFKRIGANRQLLGGPERVREDAARLQGWA